MTLCGILFTVFHLLQLLTPLLGLFIGVALGETVAYSPAKPVESCRISVHEVREFLAQEAKAAS